MIIYYVDEGIVLIDNRIFDATGNHIYDKYGNSATVYGGIIHDRLKDLGLDVRAISDRFLCWSCSNLGLYLLL